MFLDLAASWHILPWFGPGQAYQKSRIPSNNSCFLVNFNFGWNWNQKFSGNLDKGKNMANFFWLCKICDFFADQKSDQTEWLWLVSIWDENGIKSSQETKKKEPKVDFWFEQIQKVIRPVFFFCFYTSLNGGDREAC